jgi:adhesin/invasin
LLGEIPQIETMELISLVDIHVVAAIKRGQPVQTVTLRWGAAPLDLDLHFVHRSPSEAGHVWYRNAGTLESYPWATLSEDIRNGYGPEVLSFGFLAAGVYTIAVHNFSGEAPLAGCGARIDVGIGDSVKTFYCPSHGEGLWWVVFEIDMESHEIKEVNAIVTAVDWEIDPGSDEGTAFRE